MLEAVFRLLAFRPGQLEAILDVLRKGQRPKSLLCTVATGSGNMSPVSLAALASQVTVGSRTLVCRRAAPWLYTESLRCHILPCERHTVTDARLSCVLCGAFDKAHTWLSCHKWRPAMVHASARLPPSPRLALTATLRSDAEPPLLRTLGMIGAVVSRHPFFRANLCLRVEHRPLPSLPAADSCATRTVQNEEDYRVRRALHLGVDAARVRRNWIIYGRLRDAAYLAGRLHASYTAMPELHDAGAVCLP